METTLLQQLGLGVGLGLLVGLQRERATKEMAGIRTFPLITLLGVLCGALAGEWGGWIVAAGLVALATLVVMANWLLHHEGDYVGAGMTTEAAALVMFMVGAALPSAYTLEAVVGGALVALLLHWKDPLHALAERMGEQDFSALMRLTLIGIVILPVLPNQAFGPYQVLNPFKIWLMVVLIVGISMASYVAFKFFGERAGAIAAGVLGGMISSTATSVSYAQRTNKAPERSPAASVVIALASTVVFGRVLVEMAVVAPEILGQTAAPIVAMMAVMVLVSGVLYAAGIGSAEAEIEDHEPPSDLRSAMFFGVLYGAVLLAVAIAQEQFGQAGLYVVAALSGLTDVDAITLSTAQLMKTNDIATATGWRVILIGSMANLAFKGFLVASLGDRRLLARIAPAFLGALLAGGGILVLWPG